MTDFQSVHLVWYGVVLEVSADKSGLPFEEKVKLYVSVLTGCFVHDFF